MISYNNKRKGQTFTSDFLFSAVIFVFIINIAYLSWTNVKQDDGMFESDYMGTKIVYITDILTRTSGYPFGWNSTNVALVGLSDSSNMINISKVNELSNITYNNMTYMWGITDYDFNLTIYGNITYKTFGKNIDYDSEFITPIERVILIDYGNGTVDKGYLKYTLWKSG